MGYDSLTNIAILGSVLDTRVVKFIAFSGPDYSSTKELNLKPLFFEEIITSKLIKILDAHNIVVTGQFKSLDFFLVVLSLNPFTDEQPEVRWA